MNLKRFFSRVSSLTFGLACLAVSAAFGGDAPSTAAAPSATTVDAHKLAAITPGVTTKAQVHALLGVPWRIVQFNDCGKPMPGQADETWEYRRRDASGSYRLHVEFDDNNVANLVARIPDSVPGGKGTAARAVPAVMAHNDHM
jgi:hypothetical protein